MRGVFISLPVACALQAMLATRAGAYTNELRNTKDRQGDRRYRTEFSNLKQVSEQIWLSYFLNVFYKRTETNVKQTVRFNSRQTIRLEQFLLRFFLFYSFPLYIFNTYS